MLASQVAVTGTCTANQNCGTVVPFSGCQDARPASQTVGFTLTIYTCTITLSCTINPTPVGVDLNSVALAVNGSRSVSLSESHPGWLQWLEKLLADSENLNSGILGEVSTLLQSSQLETSMQAAINQLLGSSPSQE